MKPILLILGLLVLGSAQAETFYAQNDRANLMREPGFRTTVVMPVSKGTALEVLEKRKFWYRVEVDGRQGWVFSYQVSKRPPLGRVSLASAPVQSTGYNTRRRASVVTTVGAVRGLAADDRSRMSAGQQSDYLALEKMESLAISEAEVTRFWLQEGM